MSNNNEQKNTCMWGNVQPLLVKLLKKFRLISAESTQRDSCQGSCRINVPYIGKAKLVLVVKNYIACTWGT